MPFIHVRYAVQLDAAGEAALIRDLTAAALVHLHVPPDAVSVVLDPVPSTRWAVAGRQLSADGI
jgi:phenylpyruvate tautomerase PptA (4-oxalocrotonate tautomerase family)